MTTVAQLIEYLQTLPPKTTVEVSVNVDGNWSSYTVWESLKLPTQNSFNVSDNLEFCSLKNSPTLYLGRTYKNYND